MRTANLAALLLFTPSVALAQTVQIQFNQQAKSILGDELSLAENELEKLLTDEFSALYGVLRIKDFLRLSANAQNMANKGLGVDYASNPDSLIFGAAVNVAADAGDSDIADPVGSFDRGIPVSAGAQITAMVGFNFDAIGLPWLTVFANGMYFPLKVQQLDGTFFNVGGHLQAKLFGPLDAKIIEWGGIDLTSGIQMSRLEMTLSEDYEASAELIGGLSLDTVSMGKIELVQRALTVPIEISTNLTILKFVTAYVGAGLDIALGEATSSFDIESTLSTDVNGTTLDVGTATVRVDDEAKADRYLVRLLGGVQVNLWLVNIFAQLNFVTRDLALSVAAGLRFEL